MKGRNKIPKRFPGYGAYKSPGHNSPIYIAYNDFKKTLTDKQKKELIKPIAARFDILSYNDFKVMEETFNNQYKHHRHLKSTTT